MMDGKEFDPTQIDLAVSKTAYVYDTLTANIEQIIKKQTMFKRLGRAFTELVFEQSLAHVCLGREQKFTNLPIVSLKSTEKDQGAESSEMAVKRSGDNSWLILANSVIIMLAGKIETGETIYEAG